MREIKFKAWSPTESYLSGVFTIRSFTGKGPLDFIFLQYTGLKDKNGKEIYEGDIIKDIGSKVLGQMIFRDGQFTGSHLNLKQFLDCELIEVIGNIYENPELIDQLK